MHEAMAPELHDELAEGFESLQSDESAPSLLIQGTGCAGCLAARYYPFTRSCAYWLSQHALAV